MDSSDDSSVLLSQQRARVVKMQSPRMQCCMCALSVMSALLGMFMLSAGVCLVLNYNFLEVDTSGLPPNLHNEEGKKVVGIILICVGIVSMGVSALVSILFYAACSRSSPATPSKEKGQSRPKGGQDSAGRGHQHSNGVSQAGAGRRSNGASAAASAPALANGRRGNDPRGRGGAAALTPGAKDGAAGYARSGGKAVRNGATPPGPGRPYRPGKKNHHHRHGQGRFRNSLPSHPEEAGGESSQGLGESGRASARRLAYPERSGHVNEGVRLDDEVAASAENLASGSSDSSVTPSVVIKVDSSYLTDRASASQTPPQQEGSDPELANLSSSVLGAGASVTVTSEVDVTETRDAREEEEESGRMSRSTVDSSDTTDGAEDSPENTQRRQDRQITVLISERL